MGMVEKGKSLRLLDEVFVVVQCPPEWRSRKGHPSNVSFYSLTITPEECSIILPQDSLNHVLSPEELKTVKRDGDWKCYKVEGPLDFGLVGILHSILQPLRQAGISVLAVGTYNTDYFLVKTENVSTATSELVKNGFEVKPPEKTR